MQSLRLRNLRFDLIEHDAPLAHAETVWISTEVEIVGRESEGRPVAASLDDIDGAILRAIQHLRGVPEIHRLTFGVDPGPRPGIAWLADGVLLGMEQMENIEDVVEHVRAIQTAVKHKDSHIRIGDGAPSLRDHIINRCIAAGLQIEEVDEARTSRGLLRHNHVVSAVRIALIPGARVFEQRPIIPTDGELKEIQRQSRKVSNGRKTISTKLALAVARGELGMDEALSN